MAIPNNQAKGLPYISGLLILNDDETGMPLAVMDCTWITGMRTGAASALAARYLARPESSTVGILGCGVQGRTNLEALKCSFPVKQVMAYDTKPESAVHYAQEMRERLGVEVTVVTNPRDAVSGCDMVVTAGPILQQPHATIKAGLAGAGRVRLAGRLRFLLGRGGAARGRQVLHGRRAATGVLPEPRLFPVDPADLRQPGRAGHRARSRAAKSSTERTIGCNLGLALDDMATAPIVYRRAIERGIGTWLQL